MHAYTGCMCFHWLEFEIWCNYHYFIITAQISICIVRVSSYFPDTVHDCTINYCICVIVLLKLCPI